MSCIDAIRDALHLSLERDPGVIVIGEGVPDPKAIFGTTAGLRERFGPRRVFDMPLSENGMTGICIGAALTGLRPVMVHQRIDFALLAMDQIVNNAAKWHYMFNGQQGVPLVIRMIVGRGWGQGPQHAQSLQALFAHVPGLKVVMPAVAEDAKGMLCAAIRDDNPVIFIEHRWIQPIQGEVPEGYYESPLEGAVVRRRGKDVTVAAFSYMLIEALAAAEALAALGLEVEVIDMRAVSPLDVDTVAGSVKRTGRLVVVDTAHASLGVAGELIASVVERTLPALRQAPARVALPDLPSPTSPVWAESYYPDARDIARTVAAQCGLGVDAGLDAVLERLCPKGPADVPNPEYRGPF
ncbi:transketolase C-terminal domain-containing protein [Thiohalobacter sp. IOR34]|uniref:alpha-ketoacid dehydrogenase subunit beta n=1 Tax=Thiohalobacter sp. IOR34 TaxID=3057176 RepID=UPI0025B1A379|nr:transketolase C-terminal domain-containing protein [Thiohalobacter sp. IOR34]WJW74599.1 transketolase C-terminal domain-containing protein [Thiohalobacter sp. IOR34]